MSGRISAGGFNNSQDVIIPLGASEDSVRKRFPTLLSAVSQIQQFYVIEQSGQEIPDDFLTIQGKLNFFKVGLGSGFIEGLAFALLSAVVLPILSDPKLMATVARYFPLAQSKIFLWTLNLVPVILTGGLCCFLSRYRMGVLTKKAIDSLLMGRLCSLVFKGILIFAGLITLSNLITRNSAWKAAKFMSLRKEHLVHEIYSIIMNTKPQLVNMAYETVAIFALAIVMPFMTIWLVSTARKIKGKRADVFWKHGYTFKNKRKPTQGKTFIGKGYKLGDPKAIKNVWLPDSDRKAHMFCFGTTRIGKTRLIELMIEQDIRKGYSVALFDPKGDIDLFSKIVQVAFEENRQEELYLITPIFPAHSASIDPLAYYYMPEEIVSHVVSGIKAKEEFFINVAYETTLIIVLSLLLFAKIRGDRAAINFEEIHERASYGGLKNLKSQLEAIDSDEARELVHSLTQILDKPQDYFAKISSTLHSVLTTMTRGGVGSIIGKARTNEFMRRLEKGKRVILVVQTGNLLTRKTAHIIARVLLSMLQSFVGRRYASGRKVEPPLAVYLDEASNLMYIGIEDLFNKAGGAGIWVHAFSQSIADLDAEIGRDHARKILDNTNTKLFMRVNDPMTAKYIAEYSGEHKKFSPILSLGGGITIREIREQTVLPEDVLRLQARDFYLFTLGGAFRGKTANVDSPYFQIEYPTVDVL